MNIAGTSSGRDLPANKLNIYYRIRSIFPNIAADHIKDMILNPHLYDMQDVQDDQSFISNMTENLLVNGANHVDLENVARNSSSWKFEIIPTPDVQTGRLIEIFPDADPEYLKDYAEINYKNPELINTFIEDNLREKKYPSREDYVKRKKLDDDYKKYFTNFFSVAEFVKEISNPIEYFENINRECQDNDVTKALLYDLFKNVEKAVINDEYAACKFNATLTSNNLVEKHSGQLHEITKDSLKSLNMNQIHEFSFIYNKKIFEKDFENSVEEVLECQTCLTLVPASKSSTCDNDHNFCHQCIRLGTECKISEGIYNIPCFVKCNGTYSQATLKTVLNSKTYNILMQKRQEESILEASVNAESCPFCTFLQEVDEESKIFFCLNDDCRKQSCRRCKKMNHLPYECKDVLEIRKARIYLEEKMTRALIRNCLKCGKQFLKSEGCNRMTCVCGASQCYLCDASVASDNYKHFNGQGSDRHDLCPLYTDDKYQEVQSVLEVAKKTKEAILKQNPDFETEMIDVLLPVLPEKTEGPHDQIPNSNELPEHVLKVAKAIAP
ncbi:E3 ubiquitin-protein ligase RNF216-like [Leptopilina heterotoma]|uniref:E3 ubiquitin-protein ligase RNF216-like n=1 Tax=Leptopilina heterotoma TaxID=63436 RepID=UPI001CA8ACA9|nr:E3 ubiquitin-protein ligase RNF216-like [Leptopilina heterotoma]XP_043466120.1 E3 ubiquitin-protein ligase RNF216-like [Leptopilina heterotoma]